MVRCTTDAAYYPAARKAQLRPPTHAKGKGPAPPGPSAAAAAAAATAGALAAAARGAHGFVLDAFTYLAAGAAAALLGSGRAARARRSPRLHEGKGAFRHLRAAAIIVQAFARQVAALHRLYTRATITATFHWRKQVPPPAG